MQPADESRKLLAVQEDVGAASATDRQTVCECDALGPIDALLEVVVELEDPHVNASERRSEVVVHAVIWWRKPFSG
jgi:hypothetical protein